MARRPVDPIPQRQLALEYRMAIDSAMAGRKLGMRRVRRLVAENPTSTWSTHVQYNIGKGRAAWLRAYLTDVAS
jgi:hypothetical protein